MPTAPGSIPCDSVSRPSNCCAMPRTYLRRKYRFGCGWREGTAGSGHESCVLFWLLLCFASRFLLPFGDVDLRSRGRGRENAVCRRCLSTEALHENRVAFDRHTPRIACFRESSCIVRCVGCKHSQSGCLRSSARVVVPFPVRVRYALSQPTAKNIVPRPDARGPRSLSPSTGRRARRKRWWIAAAPHEMHTWLAWRSGGSLGAMPAIRHLSARGTRQASYGSRGRPKIREHGAHCELRKPAIPCHAVFEKNAAGGAARAARWSNACVGSAPVMNTRDTPLSTETSPSWRPPSR